MKIPTEGNKGQAPKTNKYRGKKKTQNKPSVETETEADFQGRCINLEGYNFDLGQRASDKFSRKMKELELCLGTTYSDIFQPAIMNETAAKLTDPEMPTITDLGIDLPKTDGEMTYLDKKNIDEAI